MSDTSPLRLEVRERIATITLNRPEAGNAIDLAMAQGLRDAAQHVAADQAVRCVVLTGSGKLFCAGGDVAAMAAAGDKAPQLLDALITPLNAALISLATMEKPLITMVNGPAAGAGFGLALAGDVVLASRSASFMAAYGAVGLTADGGLSWLLPRLVGLRRAQRLILLNEKVGAEEALALGLVTEVVDDAALAAEGRAMAERLRGGSMTSIGGARALLRQCLESDLASQLDRERASMVAAASSTAMAEGVAAFMARRKPDFEGVE